VAERDCYCPVEVALLSGAKHSPHREAPEVALKTIADFANHLLAGASKRAAQQHPLVPAKGGDPGAARSTAKEPDSRWSLCSGRRSRTRVRE
jgi:hypothetical protein